MEKVNGYFNLKAEMARTGLKQKDIAALLKISHHSAYNRISGITDFNVMEAVMIRETLFPGMPIDYLFEN